MNKPLKELKFKLFIATADFDRKIRDLEKFLSKGHRVRIKILLRGRRNKPEYANDIINRILNSVKDYGTIQGEPDEGKFTVVFYINPKKKNN